jgi:hypothetical protein
MPFDPTAYSIVLTNFKAAIFSKIPRESCRWKNSKHTLKLSHLILRIGEVAYNEQSSNISPKASSKNRQLRHKRMFNNFKSDSQTQPN